MQIPSYAFAAALVMAPLAAAADDGSPIVNVRSPSALEAVADAGIDISASPTAIWSTLTACEDAPRFVPNLISCKTLEKGPRGRWEIQEQILKGPFLTPRIRNVYRMDFVKHRQVRFRLVEGDWKLGAGRWIIRPTKNGAHLTYQMHVIVNGPAPPGILRSELETNLRDVVLAVRTEAIRIQREPS
jgi:hypothetical protein